MVLGRPQKRLQVDHVRSVAISVARSCQEKTTLTPVVSCHEEKTSGGIQSSGYGYRVRLKLGGRDGKDYYGPYRATLECAREDLAKLGAAEAKKKELGM